MLNMLICSSIGFLVVLRPKAATCSSLLQFRGRAEAHIKLKV
jgi:hypothetical protein